MSVETAWIVAIVAVVTLIFNTIIQIRGGAWNTAQREHSMKTDLTKTITDSVDKLRSETTQNLASINIDLDKARAESQEQHDDAMVKFGDTIAAIKQKVNDDALYAERTFMRREEHNAHAQQHQRSFDTLDRKMDERFNRVEQLLFAGVVQPAPGRTPPKRD